MRGDISGMLTGHPMSTLLSLHHVEVVDPIFPDMNRTQGLQHLFNAVNVDPPRILQKTVCYDRSNQLTVSVVWGYVVQVYEGNHLLPDLLPLQRTFSPWVRGSKVDTRFMFNLREHPRDICKRPAVFYLDSVKSEENIVQSYYVKHVAGNCNRSSVVNNLEKILVFSQKQKLEVEEVAIELVLIFFSILSM